MRSPALSMAMNNPGGSVSKREWLAEKEPTTTSEAGFSEELVLEQPPVSI